VVVPLNCLVYFVMGHMLASYDLISDRAVADSGYVILVTVNSRGCEHFMGEGTDFFEVLLKSIG